MTFKFEVGKVYETLAGNKVMVLGRTDLKGYECLMTPGELLVQTTIILARITSFDCQHNAKYNRAN